MAKGNRPIFVRVDETFRSRLKRHAESPQFGGNESNFARYSLGTVMDLREALGPRFELEVARLLEQGETAEGRAA
jgi:hypothetical protein